MPLRRGVERVVSQRGQVWEAEALVAELPKRSVPEPLDRVEPVPESLVVLEESCQLVVVVMLSFVFALEASLPPSSAPSLQTYAHISETRTLDLASMMSSS